MKQPVIVKNVEKDDAIVIAVMGKDMFNETQYSEYEYDVHKTNTYLKAMVADEQDIILAAWIGEEMVGFLLAEIGTHWWGKCRFSYDLCFYVKPQWRGSKAAPMLLDGYIKQAKEQKVDEVCIGVSTGIYMEATEKLFGRFGFERIGSNFKLHKR